MRRLLLFLVLGACACGGPLVPVKRTLALQPAGGYAVTLVYPGLQAHQAKGLLEADATAHAERFSCPVRQVTLTAATEETTPPPKEAPEGAEPKSMTKVEGVYVCPAAQTLP